MARIAPATNLGPLLEKKPLVANGSNYADWIRALRIVLRGINKGYLLDAPPPLEDIEYIASNTWALKKAKAKN